MYKTILFALIFVLSPLGVSHADTLFRKLPNEVAVWADANGFTGSTEKRGSSGCLQGKRYVPFSKTGVKGHAVFFHPLYQEETAIVSNVIYEFDPPLSRGQARAYAIKLAPIIGTRPPTHTQSIKVDPNNACIPAGGGKEERYTEDWIVEMFPAGGSVKKMSVYNDYVR